MGGKVQAGKEALGIREMRVWDGHWIHGVGRITKCHLHGFRILSKMGPVPGSLANNPGMGGVSQCLEHISQG